MYGKITMITFRDNLDSNLLLKILKEFLLPEANYFYSDVDSSKWITTQKTLQ